MKHITFLTLLSLILFSYNHRTYSNSLPGESVASMSAPFAHLFETTWKTDNPGISTDNQITIPTIPGEAYNYQIFWGDGSEDNNVTGTITHTYATPGTYFVAIGGIFPGIKMGGSGEEQKLIEIRVWGEEIVWSTMERAFSGCSNLNVTATDFPDLSNVTSLGRMFEKCSSLVYNSSIDGWDVSNVVNMSWMFDGASIFNQPLANWDTSSVTRMENMFHKATLFNQPIGGWNISNVRNLSFMLAHLQLFDQELTNWDTGQVNNMFGTFYKNTNFNSDISNWSTSNVTNMEALFLNATSFNQDIGNWDVSKVNNMGRMFWGSSFDQDLGDWNISNVVTMQNMFAGISLSTQNYDAILEGWNALPTLKFGVVLNAGNSQYCLGEAGRQKLIDDFGWAISDGGKTADCSSNGERPFVTTWKTDNEGSSADNQIMIPTFPGESYNYSVEWGDGSTDTNVTGDITHTYASTGTYQVSINGDFPRIYFNYFPQNEAKDYEKLIAIDQWGDIQWTSMDNAFTQCVNLDILAVDTPILSNVHDMEYMFRGCSNLIGNTSFSSWDVSNVTAMFGVFIDAPQFNQDISTWDVSNVTDLGAMFLGASSFNQDISNWDVSKVTRMVNLFSYASSFNQSIGGWDVSKVNDMGYMFRAANSFNEDITSWDVSNVTRMEGMFLSNQTFDQNIGNWNISAVTNMAVMLLGTQFSVENYDAILEGWNSLPSLQNNVEFDAGGTKFCSAEAARQNLIDTYGWTITDGGEDPDCNVSVGRPFITRWKTYISETPINDRITIPTVDGETYNYSVDWGDGNTDTGITGDITHIYSQPGSYTISINGTFPRMKFKSVNRNRLLKVLQWGDIQWSSMEEAFSGCKNLDVTATDTPDLSQVTSLASMFLECNKLKGNANFDTWTVSTITNLNSTFGFTFVFNQPLSSWDVSNVTDMAATFTDAFVFDQPLGNWDVAKVENMSGLFANAFKFNQDIGNWNTGEVTNMEGTFTFAAQFNQDIGNWDVSKVENMRYMFFGTPAFDQNIGAWQVQNVTNFEDTFLDVNLSTENYDALLLGWSSLPTLLNGVNLNMSNSQYCQGADARQQLINTYGWTINDGGEDPQGCSVAERPFVTTWKTDNLGPSADNQITIPTDPEETYDYNVDWGDGNTSTNLTGNSTHTYNSPGTYTVSVTGIFPRIYFQGPNPNNDDQQKILAVNQWGDISWISMDRAFSGCSNLDVVAADVPDLSRVDNLQLMFDSCTSLIGNANFANWVMTNVTSLSGMFFGAHPFNQDIGNWNVGNVQNFSGMFSGTLFNQDIGNWDVSNGTSFGNMFEYSAFNQDISTWNVSNGIGFESMFYEANNFNQDIGGWDVSNAQYTYVMFNGADAFNQDLGSWDVSSVTNMNAMFAEAASFDQNLGSWNVSNVALMNAMFEGVTLSVENYDALLAGWSTLPSLQNGVNFDGGNSQYCQGASARQQIIDNYGWTITDGGEDPQGCSVAERPFVTTWKTDNEGLSNDNEVLIFITNSAGVTIDWGDGATDNGVTQPITHAYEVPGSYQIAISGDYPRIIFGYTAYSYGNDRNKLVSVDQWGDTQWTTMEYAFMDCQNVQILAEDVPNLSLVTSMGRMFQNADAMNEDISSWDFSSVTNMFRMFLWADSFNQDITKWDFPYDISLGDFLSGASSFDQDLSDLDLSKISSMAGFLSGSGLSQENYDKTLIGWANQSFIPLNLWVNVDGTSFCGGENARQRLIDDYSWTIHDGGLACPSSIPFITSWKTDNEGSSGDNQINFPVLSPAEATIDWGDGTIDTKVKHSITHTYAEPGIYQISVSGILPNLRIGPEVSYFDTDKDKLISVNQWGDTKWLEMEAAFQNCQNVQILADDDPDLSSVSSMRLMFSDADAMNNDISSWDFTSVSEMNAMFYKADSFNQDISNWNFGNQVDLAGMFQNAESFDQNLGSLDLSKVISLSGIFSSSGLSQENYDNTLIGWAAQDLIPQNISMQANGVEFCRGEQARQNLINDYNWYITDGGKAADCPDTTSFITTWKTDNVGASNDNQITIPTFPGESYNYSVYWGDGTSNTGVTGDITHTYSSAGGYTVSISGDFPRIYFNQLDPVNGDANKIVSVLQWGDIDWKSMEEAFVGCSNLDVVATDAPNLLNVQSLQGMFYLCSSLVGNGSISLWDVSNVQNYGAMFRGTTFNQDIGQWNTSTGTQMFLMFADAINFNQNIGAWNVSNVTNMSGMFEGAAVFNQDIGNWDVSQVTSMFTMFNNAIVFNQNIGNWDVSSVTDMQGMFVRVDAFDQNISLWDVSNVTNLSEMFFEAESFNQDISNWNVSQVTQMFSMFDGATSFDQNIGGWNVSNVTNMNTMFNRTSLSVQNYDSLLIGWSNQNLQNGVTFDGGNSQYCLGVDARQNLIDSYGWTITDGGQDSIGCQTPTLSITDFVLVDAITDIDIMTLVDGDNIDLSSLPSTSLNIRANTAGEVSSVSLAISGTLVSSRTEGKAPYALFGDSNGNYVGRQMPVGPYTLSATPYSAPRASGDAGNTATINFSFNNSNAAKGIDTFATTTYDIALFPNAASEAVTISVSDPTVLVQYFLVYDVSGRQVGKFNANEVTSGTEFRLPVNQYQAGIYFVMTVDSAGRVSQNQLLVK